MMNAQQRTLDDLKTGVNVQIDKGGHIRYRQQPQMGLPSVNIIDKSEYERLKEYSDEGWAWVDEFCKLSGKDVFDLRDALKEKS